MILPLRGKITSFSINHPTEIHLSSDKKGTPMVGVTVREVLKRGK